MCCLALAVPRLIDLADAEPESPQAVNTALKALISGLAGLLLAAFAFLPAAT